ncbi:cysteine-rich DPF motif domain-containing protein 1 [Ixodes scapularis]
MQRKSGPIDEKDRQEDKYFVCDVCNMREKYHVETDAIKRLELRFLEKVYLIKDGTGEDIGGFAVGSHCSECDRCVCLSSECSVFYTRRFCKDCFSSRSRQFPPQIGQIFQGSATKASNLA